MIQVYNQKISTEDALDPLLMSRRMKELTENFANSPLYRHYPYVVSITVSPMGNTFDRESLMTVTLSDSPSGWIKLDKENVFSHHPAGG